MSLPLKTTASELGSTTDPAIFILENNTFLAEYLAKIAQKAGWRPIVARHVEEAVALAQRENAAIKLAIIDTFIANNEEAYGALQRLETERLQLTSDILREGCRVPSSKGKRELRLRHSVLGASMDQYLSPEGGIDFLARAQKNSWFAGWRYIIFTTTPKIMQERELQERISSGKYLGWYEQPISADVLAHLMRKERARLGRQVA